MSGNWRIIGAWLMRALLMLPKWWNYEYRDFRVIVEQDSHLRYFRLPAGLQRAFARCAVTGFITALVSLTALGLTSYLLNSEKIRLEASRQSIYATLLGDSGFDMSSFTEAELLNLVQEAKERQHAIQQYLGFSAVTFKEENQSLMSQLLDTGLTEKVIQAIQQASVAGGRELETESHSSPQNLLPDPLVKDILKNRELHDVLRALPEQMPLERAEISSDFGIRKHPITGIVHFHTGVDLVVDDLNSKVFPAKTGKVITATMHPQLGNMVLLQHSNGIQTLYAHMQNIKVKAGDIVQLDTVIGNVGNTGASSTGPHLHFEVLVGGFPANPIKVIRAAKNVQQIL